MTSSRLSGLNIPPIGGVSSNSPTLPPWIPPVQNPTPSRGDINSVNQAPSQRYATVAAEGTFVPVVYGRDYLGPIISLVTARSGYLFVRCVWCLGEIDSVESVTLNDLPLPNTIQVNHYTGTTSQGIDPLLAAAIPGYADNCVVVVDGVEVGIAYSVFKIPAGVTQTDEEGNVAAIDSSFPRFLAKIRGLKVRDPRDSNNVSWSSNPALVLANLIENPIFGLGAVVNDDSLASAANFNDSFVGITSDIRNSINLAMTSRQSIQSWIEAFRAYSRCFIVPRGDEILFVPDTVSTSVGSIGAGQIVSQSFNLQKRSLLNAPNVVRVYYTSVSGETPREEFVEVSKASVIAGVEARRESSIRMPGLHSRSQAHRFAVEKLNEASIIDLSGTFTCWDHQWKYEIGDVISLSHPIGLVDKLVRITGVNPADRGKLKISFVEYSDDVYSDDVVEELPPPDAGGESPLVVPSLAGLTAVEEFRVTPVQTSTQIRVSWDSLTYSFLQHYVLDVLENGVKISTIRTVDNFWVIQNPQIGAVYSFKAYALSVAFVAGPRSETSLQSQGYLIPPDFSSGKITAYEAGDAINAYVTTGAIDIDLWGYEWRYREISSANLLASGGPVFSSSDWTFSGAWSFNLRSMSFTNSGTTAVSSTASTGLLSLVSGESYDIYVKVNKLTSNTSINRLRVFPDWASSDFSSQGSSRVLEMTKPGLYVIKNLEIVDNSQNINFQVDFGSSASSTSREVQIEYIAARQSSPSSDWDSATFYDRSTSTFVRLTDIPSGDYLVYCKAIDNVRNLTNPLGQYSSTAQTDFSSLASDSGAFTREIFPIVPSNRVNMSGFERLPAPTLTEAARPVFDSYLNNETWVPASEGVRWDIQLDRPIADYINPLINYFSVAASEQKWLSKVTELARLNQGTLTVSLNNRPMTWSELDEDGNPNAATSAPRLLLWSSNDNVSFSSQEITVNSPVQFSGQSFYLEFRASGASVTHRLRQVIDLTNRAFVQLVQRTFTESGTIDTLGPDLSGDAQPVTVTLTRLYSSVTEVRGWVQTTEPIQVYVDNIQFGADATTFDVIAVNLRGEPVALTINWIWRGV